MISFFVWRHEGKCLQTCSNCSLPHTEDKMEGSLVGVECTHSVRKLRIAIFPFCILPVVISEWTKIWNVTNVLERSVVAKPRRCFKKRFQRHKCKLEPRHQLKCLDSCFCPDWVHRSGALLRPNKLQFFQLSSSHLPNNVPLITVLAGNSWSALLPLKHSWYKNRLFLSVPTKQGLLFYGVVPFLTDFLS